MTRKIIGYHSIAWAGFIGYEVLTIYFVVGRTAPFVDYITHYILNILLFYVNAIVIIRHRNIWQALIFISFEIVVYMFANFLLNSGLEYFVLKITRPVSPLRAFLIASFWRCVYFLGLSTLYGFAVNLLRSRNRELALTAQTIQKEKDQALLENNLISTQNALLRAQINPHLFFNTLNFVYNSVYKISANAGEAVLLLADITRYSISRGDHEGKVMLKDELGSIQDLISLNQIRFGGRLNIRFDIIGDYSDYKIIPLILITLVENVFKYADLEDQLEPAIIQLYRVEDIIHFATKNKKMTENSSLVKTGIGIENTRFRLQQAYPGNFSLRINETNDKFFVDLSIKENMICLAAI